VIGYEAFPDCNPSARSFGGYPGVVAVQLGRTAAGIWCTQDSNGKPASPGYGNSCASARRTSAGIGAIAVTAKRDAFVAAHVSDATAATGCTRESLDQRTRAA